MTTYLVPAQFGQAEYVEKRSRFISRVWPVECEAEALSHIEAMRKQHYDASHNVYAYILRDNGIMRYSDDGEPSGTSGQPVLNVFRSEGIYNVCCVVTRYFGGILLGAGGLVRAYSAAAKMGLDAAGISQMALWRSCDVVCSYGQFERVKRLLEENCAVIEDTAFAVDVAFKALLREDIADNFMHSLTEMTAGSAHCRFGAQCFRGVKIR